MYFLPVTAASPGHSHSLHDALPICSTSMAVPRAATLPAVVGHRCVQVVGPSLRGLFRQLRVEGGALHVTVGEPRRSEEHTSELQSPCNLVCRVLLVNKKN